jgi:integrase
MLSDLACRSAKPRAKPYKLTDGAGLYLHVLPAGPRTPGGSKVWRYRFRIAGRESIYTIGEYPGVSLADARLKLAEARALVKQGRNPSVQRKAEIAENVIKQQSTFAALARVWYDERAPKWSDSYRRGVSAIIDKELIPKLGPLPVAEIKTAHVRAVIDSIKKRSKTTAILARQIAYQIFNDASNRGLAPEINPAASLKGAVQRGAIKHAKALTQKELSELLAKIELNPSRVSGIALLLLAHTMTRTAELRKATWNQFDFQHCEWRIPSQNMKMRRLHVVPLTHQTIVLLHELMMLTGRGTDVGAVVKAGGYLLPNKSDPNRPIAASTLNRSLERAGANFSCHGFRATAATILSENNFNVDAIERQLAHTEKNATKRAYLHAEFLPERRTMMNWWSELIERLCIEASN